MTAGIFTAIYLLQHHSVLKRGFLPRKISLCKCFACFHCTLLLFFMNNTSEYDLVSNIIRGSGVSILENCLIFEKRSANHYA